MGRVERSRPGRSRATARPRMQLRRLQPAAPAPSGRVAGWRRDRVRSGAGACVQNGFGRNGPCYGGTPLEDRIDGFRESTSRWNGNVTAAAGRSGDAEVCALVTREVKASGVRFGRFRDESNGRGGASGSSRRMSSVLPSWLGPVCSVVRSYRQAPGSGPTLPTWLDPVCLVDEALRLSARSPVGSGSSAGTRGRTERCHLQGLVPAVPSDPPSR